VIAFIPVFASLLLPFDYGIYGIALIGCMYMLTKNTKFGVVMVVLLNALFLMPLSSQILSLLALPLILLHNNGSLTRKIEFSENFAIPAWRKYFFYVYYPLHLALLYLLNLCYF
jgi:hypothetical protein